MSSLPQGWHGVNGPMKKTAQGKTETSSAGLTPRKKWNSPKSADVPRTMLPTLRKNSVPLVPNGTHSKINTSTRSSAKASDSFRSQLPESSTSSAKARESQNEIMNLKKEVASLKAENAIIKARLRRIDDENNQKARLIEKLQAEKKVGTLTQRKNKDSENALLLRQKCLRLESALKEKDLSMKKMVAEIKSVKEEELKDLVEKYHKQFGLSNGLGGDLFRIHRIVQPTMDSRMSSSRPGRTNIRDQAMKSEVQKLQDMLHKLEIENKNLLSQLKEKDLEIRRLKLQMQRQSSRPQSNQPSGNSSSSRLSQPDVRCNVSSSRRGAVSSTALSRQLRVGSIEASSQNKNKTPARPASTVVGRMTTQQQRQRKSFGSKSAPLAPEPTFVVKKVQAVPKNKPSTSRQRTPPKTVGCSAAELEIKVKNMRENIAARKIQQGWRHHRKMMNQGASKEKQAVITLCSELKKHKIRKDRLKFFLHEDYETFQLTSTEEDQVLQEIKSAVDALFRKNS